MAHFSIPHVHSLAALALATLTLLPVPGLQAALLKSTPVPVDALQAPVPASTTGESGYEISWWTVDNGGATSAAGSGYSLGGTIAQPEAAIWSGSGYTLTGGFWRSTLDESTIYLPLVLRSS